MIGDPFKISGQRGPSVGCSIVMLAAFGFAGYFTWSSIRASSRANNEMDAFNSLARLARAEAEYRANDPDGNGVHDFWTADVAGLYKYGLIDRAIAEADAEPLTPLAPKPIPCKGYYVRALISDDADFSEPYRQDTDKKSGKVHHGSKFGFVAFPAEPGATGKYMWIVNENNSAFRHDLTIPVPRHWPKDYRAWGLVQ